MNATNFKRGDKVRTVERDMITGKVRTVGVGYIMDLYTAFGEEMAEVNFVAGRFLGRGTEKPCFLLHA